MKSTIGRWKGQKVTVDLVNELAVTGTVKAVDKIGLLIEPDEKQQRYIPTSAILQIIRKKPAKAKRGAEKK